MGKQGNRIIMFLSINSRKRKYLNLQLVHDIIVPFASFTASLGFILLFNFFGYPLYSEQCKLLPKCLPTQNSEQCLGLVACFCDSACLSGQELTVAEWGSGPTSNRSPDPSQATGHFYGKGELIDQ